ncbi:hypothetical protein AVEN_216384-1, partial [Araneus ventricosus]
MYVGLVRIKSDMVKRSPAGGPWKIGEE